MSSRQGKAQEPDTPASDFGFSRTSRMRTSRSTISTSLATCTAVSGLSPVIMMHCTTRMSTALARSTRRAYTVGRVIEHLERFNRIGLERTVEHEEAHERQRALNLISGEFVDLPTHISPAPHTDPTCHRPCLPTCCPSRGSRVQARGYRGACSTCTSHRTSRGCATTCPGSSPARP